MQRLTLYIYLKVYHHGYILIKGTCKLVNQVLSCFLIISLLRPWNLPNKAFHSKTRDIFHITREGKAALRNVTTSVKHNIVVFLQLQWQLPINDKRIVNRVYIMYLSLEYCRGNSFQLTFFNQLTHFAKYVSTLITILFWLANLNSSR